MAPMNNLNQSDVQVEYIDIAKGLWPLFLAGFAVAIATGATHVKKGYLQRNKLSIALNIILSSAVSSAISLGFALLAPLFYPGITADMKLGIVLVINGIGLKLFDVYMRKKHGLQVVDLSDTADIHELRKSMTPEQRQLHAQDCPFKGSECCGGTNQAHLSVRLACERSPPKAKKSEHRPGVRIKVSDVDISASFSFCAQGARFRRPRLELFFSSVFQHLPDAFESCRCLLGRELTTSLFGLHLTLQFIKMLKETFCGFFHSGGSFHASA